MMGVDVGCLLRAVLFDVGDVDAVGIVVTVGIFQSNLRLM